MSSGADAGGVTPNGDVMPAPPLSEDSAEGGRDRQVFDEVARIGRALEAHGSLTAQALRRTVGAGHWEKHRFERALAFAVADGRVTKGADGLLHHG